MLQTPLFRAVRRTADVFQNVLFPSPPTCALCHRLTEVSWTSSVCNRCLEQLPVIGRRRCRRCGRAIGGKKSSCRECSFRPGAVDYGRAYGVYDGYLRQSIHRLKFQGEIKVAQGLGELMAWVIATDGAFGPIDGVVAVPLHSSRERQRGYNQADELATVVARELRKPLLRPAMRLEDSTPQAKLSWSERRANVQRAFTIPVPERVRGRRLLLVDDVWTTGSTLSSLALTLKRAGARRCTSICAAASSLDQEFTSD